MNARKSFLKITISLDTRNSKNSKRILFIVLELYWSRPKACILYLLPLFNFVTVAKNAYYVIILCPICWDHYIPYLMYFKLVYSFYNSNLYAKATYYP